MFDYVAPGRPYTCPIYNEEFYFIYTTREDGKVLNEYIPKNYPNYSEVVGYLYLRCDESGKKLFDVTKKKAINVEIEKLEKVQRFDEHLIAVYSFIAGVGKDDELLSDQEGSIDQGKKKSSGTVSKE